MKRLPTILITITLFGYLALQASAQTMSNQKFILEQGNLNSYEDQSTTSNSTVTSTAQRLAPGTFAGTNYKIRANYSQGFVASRSSALTFSISNTSISFGTITPGDSIIRANNLTISSPISGYTITASENSALKNATGAIIPNTTCDAGNCSYAISGLWTSPLTYGFGYRCDNILSGDCVSEFSNTNYYKSFANSSNGNFPQVVMSNINPVTTSQTQITYKLNIAGTQPSGQYQNTIQYIATPSL